MSENKTSNEKKSKLLLFGKIHLFDLVMLFLILVLFVGLANKLTGGKLISAITGDKDVRVKVVLQTREYPLEALENIKVGDKLAENKQYLDGEITYVEIVDRVVSFPNENGEVIMGSDPTAKSAIVTLEATAKYKEPVYSFGKQEFIPGSYLFLTTTTLNLKTVVISCEPLK